ncbi:zinc finger protein 16-like [Cylas formicarius]|uniref:zinc finger protein 16-like n=1 Tax=Cylas formicarius TaxID=197179 RepID=UPI002958793C|nr:zinc finger protein 16-like [Cylas formicarius]
MDVDEEPTAFLNYLDDEDSPNGFLLGDTGDGLFPDERMFTDIDAADWPTEGFSTLLPNPLLSDDSLKAEKNVLLSKEPTLQSQNQGGVLDIGTRVVTPEDNSDAQVSNVNVIQNESSSDVITNVENDSAYINCSPIVNEKSNGVKEIYLTEGDINNEAQAIHLLNPDGSVIVIDKSILSSVNGTECNIAGVPKHQKSIRDFFTTTVANKCKLCSYLSESIDGIMIHISEAHSEHFFSERDVAKADKQKLEPFENFGMSQKCLISILKKAKLKSNTAKDPPDEYHVFMCSTCEEVFSEKEDLTRHSLEVHNEKYPEQTIEDAREIDGGREGREALKKLSLFLVKKQQRALQAVKCRVSGCPSGFPDEEIREKHEQCHIADKKSQFRCLSCDKKFSIWRIAKSHMFKEHQIDFGLVVCPMCSKFKSYNSAAVMKHMKTHQDERPFMCAECGKRFKLITQLKNHETSHNRCPENMPQWATTRKCNVCELSFANAKSLKQHVLSVHKNFKPFICNVCGHKTTRKAMLELHLRQHTGAKPHKCLYCAYRTGDHNCLRKHMMKHIGAKQYSCPHCSYSCIQSSSLKSHLINRHPGRDGTFKCDSCSYMTISEAFFMLHKKSHQVVNNGAGDRHLTHPPNQHARESKPDTDDDTQGCFVAEQQVDDPVDTGGITIPAGFEIPIFSG